MGSRPLRGYASAPPRNILVEVDAPQPPAPPPQQVLVAAAEELGDTLKYFLNARNVLEVASNAIILVDAIMPTSRALSAAASPNPIHGILIEGVFLAFIDASSVDEPLLGPLQGNTRYTSTRFMCI